MSNPEWEKEPNTDIELGGGLRDPDNEQSFKLARLHGELEVGGISARGGVDGPAGLAPLVLVIAAMIAGGIIWAASSNWPAGASAMVGSLVAYIIFVLSHREEGRD
ncbi:hypothetical protein [Arthrobacter sp. BE255]|uniref:hypothetical protein n=1 Tax=Arthrobacter sp. BE255 TaxID=2817721 RepID=UPI002864A450|nr:hypothetical protein [Arthrobacter sp. BE255]MDR7161802.1 hypothetical protein [Arthrobacter sp. BE255]